MSTAPNKWLPILQMALSGLIAGKDLTGLQGIEKALANAALAILAIWEEKPESDLGKAIDMLFAALRDKNEPAIAAMGVGDRFMLTTAINMLVKSKGVRNG